MAPELHLVADPRNINTETASVRIVVADDHKLMRSSLRRLLEDEQDLEVIGEASDLASALGSVDDQRPDVLVLDLRMPGGSSLEAIATLRKQAPETAVVVVTMEKHPRFAEHALAAGALGFVLKDHAELDLIDAVRAAARGERYVSVHLDTRPGGSGQVPAGGALSERELEVLRLITLGHTSVEVARMLGISPRTVESHRARIHNKLGLTTRAELVRYALGRGLLRA